jgi:hypothetical protein
MNTRAVSDIGTGVMKAPGDALFTFHCCWRRSICVHISGISLITYNPALPTIMMKINQLPPYFESKKGHLSNLSNMLRKNSNHIANKIEEFFFISTRRSMSSFSLFTDSKEDDYSADLSCCWHFWSSFPRGSCSSTSASLLPPGGKGRRFMALLKNIWSLLIRPLSIIDYRLPIMSNGLPIAD